ncbi:MAG: T9SS type A sorting domain-containing protein [Ignavibacteriales bacterium]|nr:T9SS type A sorting domain-containing protein [Ignavibacteriales bacterium]
MKTIPLSLLCFALLCVHPASAQNFWQQTNGPFGGNVSSLAVAPNGSVFLGSNGGGVFRSTDGGQSWIQMGLANIDVRVLAINANGTVFAGAYVGGVYRSTDNGRSWTQTGLMYDGVRSLAIAPNGDIYAGAYADVFGVSESVLRSTDNGATWSVTGLTVEWNDIMTLAVNSKGNIFAGAVSGLFDYTGGVYRSLDSGKTWTPVTLGLTSVPAYAIATSPGGDLYAGTNAGVFRSSNNGGNWTKTASTVTDAGTLAINANGDVFAGNGSGIFRSTNSGATWTRMNVGLTSTDVNALALGSTAQVFAGTGNSVFRSSDNGGSWTQTNNGFVGTRIQCLGSLSNGKLIAGTNIGVFFSPDNGDHWASYNFGLTSTDVRSIVVSTNGSILVGTTDGVSRSPDTLYNWIPSGLSSHTVQTLAVNSSGDIFAGTDSGMFRSTDNGGKWTPAGPAGKEVSVVAIQSGGYGYAGLRIGVYRSTDNGANWYPSGLTNVVVQTLAFTSSGWVLAGTQDGVYRSQNNGTSWQPMNPLPSVANALVVNATGQVFAGTESDGVFQSTDEGGTWNSLTTGLLNSSTLSLAADPIGFLFAGSGGSGVFKSVQSTLAVVTQPATSVDAISATLNGIVNPSGMSTTAYFESGTSSTLSTVTTTKPKSIGSGVVAISVSDSLRGLSPSTTYYFRIVSENSAGTKKGQILSFATSSKPPTVTTNGVSSVTVNSATLNGTVNPNGATTTAYFKWGTTANLATSDSTSVQNKGSGLNDQAVTASISGLTSNTPYYFQIVAQNSAGSQKGSIESFTTHVAAPGAVALSSPQSGAMNQLLTPTLSWSAVATATIYHLQVSANSSFTPPLVVDDSTLTLTSRQIGPLLFNTIYYWRVSASNSGGTGQFSNFASLMTLPSAPANIAARTTLNFPARTKRADYGAADYRIVGLPGASNLSIGSIVTGNHSEDWEVYWDNGTANDYLQQYDGGAAFQFSVGRAFWVLSKSAINIDRSVAAAPLSSAYEADVPLHPGWNLITNPFGSSIPWSRIQAANGNLTTPIYSFFGSFAPSTSFDPCVGYYFFNGSPATTLSSIKVPYQAIYADLVDVPVGMRAGWVASVQLSASGVVDCSTRFGMSDAAERGLDQFDVHKPRAIGSLPSIAFERPQWDPEFTSFAADIRSPIGDLEKWEIDVRSERGSETSLTFRGIKSIPSQFEVYLVDKERTHSADLRKDSVYIFTATGDHAELCILVGRKDLVIKQAAEVIPTELSLSQNYPNPFNPVTSVVVSLPTVSVIRLAVFNILGQSVRVLFAGSLEPGQHRFSWDAKDERALSVPSGVYYCRLDVSNARSLTSKMILIK